ncbi:hypothetical protein H6P81_012532 [Aristolochia fimbriata]|uniref:Uncharacterized protein n=1 Tax=Aristolochia fimbriata TaxID=158543 RepID=A0AAV7ECF3_ARIFI|nr:hypothetical protein H6P81_012532 [Aristolochia fimbriata]
MDRISSGGMSWADQWDYTPDPPPAPPLDDEQHKKGKGSSKNRTRFKRIKLWMKEFGHKKSLPCTRRFRAEVLRRAYSSWRRHLGESKKSSKLKELELRYLLHSAGGTQKLNQLMVTKKAAKQEDASDAKSRKLPVTLYHSCPFGHKIF